MHFKFSWIQDLGEIVWKLQLAYSTWFFLHSHCCNWNRLGINIPALLQMKEEPNHAKEKKIGRMKFIIMASSPHYGQVLVSFHGFYIYISLKVVFLVRCRQSHFPILSYLGKKRSIEHNLAPFWLSDFLDLPLLFLYLDWYLSCWLYVFMDHWS